MGHSIGSEDQKDKKKVHTAYTGWGECQREIETGTQSFGEDSDLEKQLAPLSVFKWEWILK